MPDMGVNQRTEEREVVDGEIRFRYPLQIDAHVTDLSTGGFGAEVPVQLEVDTAVEIEIFEGRLLASGTVRWLKREGDRVRIGIRFREEDRAVIEEVRALRGHIS